MSENISTPKRRKRKPSKKAQEVMAAALPDPKGDVTMGPVVIKGIECEVVNVVPFSERVHAFNIMYKLPVNTVPTNQGVERMRKFKDILLEEVKEADDIIHRLEVAENFRKQGLIAQAEQAELTAFTDQLDWFTDVQVYCISEMWKWGLNPELGQRIVMDSNASKLGEDGNPIYDERGKVMKGKGYWKPEPLMMKELRLIIAKDKNNAKG